MSRLDPSYLGSEPGETSSGSRCSGSEMPSPGACLYVDLLRHVDIGVVVLDVEAGRLVFENEPAARALETMDGGAAGGDDRGSIQSLFEGAAEAIERRGKGGQRTTRIGSRLIGFTPHVLPDGKVVVFLRDVTEKLRLEAVAETVSHMDNIGYIFSGIRHEIGNPLNSIKMALSVLEKNLENFSQESVREYIERALGQVTRIEYLLHGLKSFNMFEKPRPQTVELDVFFSSFVSLIKKDFIDKGVRISCRVDADASTVVADPRALQHVMLNLVNNAADALEERIVSEIRVEASRSGDRVTVTVEDKGCGIPEAHKQHLFKPFFTSKPQGSGLGLVIVKKLLVEMEGEIEISSQEGVGTLVRVSLIRSDVDGAGR